jgi:hypothetical protein
MVSDTILKNFVLYYYLLFFHFYRFMFHKIYSDTRVPYVSKYVRTWASTVLTSHHHQCRRFYQRTENHHNVLLLLNAWNNNIHVQNVVWNNNIHVQNVLWNNNIHVQNVVWNNNIHVQNVVWNNNIHVQNYFSYIYDENRFMGEKTTNLSQVTDKLYVWNQAYNEENFKPKQRFYYSKLTWYNKENCWTNKLFTCLPLRTDDHILEWSSALETSVISDIYF